MVLSVLLMCPFEREKLLGVGGKTVGSGNSRIDPPKLINEVLISRSGHSDQPDAVGNA